MSRKPDPRPERTRALLWNALLDLIQEKRWDKIRVQDILERTGVGRSTFYAHFDNKFDLLTGGIPSLTVPISAADGEPDLLPLFEHVKDMQHVLLPLMSQPLLGEVMDTFQRQLAVAWVEHLEIAGIPANKRPIPAELLAGGFLSVARLWLKNGCDTTPVHQCDEFSQYMRLILDQAHGGRAGTSGTTK